MKKPSKSKRKAAAKKMVNKKRPVVIDLHGHIVVPEVFAITKKYSLHNRIGLKNRTSLGNVKKSQESFARMIDPALRLKDMDRMGVDMQVISPSLIHQNTASLKGERALKLVQKVNDGVAEAVADNPDRIAGLGMVPFHEPKLAVKELDRLVNRLGLRGVEIPTYVNGMELGDKAFRPFWRKAEKLDIPVFLHPAGNSDQRLHKFGMAFTVGQPYEETLALSSLIYDGVMDRFPKLKVLVAHGGGYLPYYAGRQDSAHRAGTDGAKLKGDISSYIRKFYYETVIFNPDMLDFLATKVSTRQILMGTDYPFGEKRPITFIKKARTLSDNQKEAVLGKNAARLLKIRI